MLGLCGLNRKAATGGVRRSELRKLKPRKSRCKCSGFKIIVFGIVCYSSSTKCKLNEVCARATSCLH
jgi:hypothetical protein